MHRQLFTRERDREKVKVWFLWSWEEICLASKSWIIRWNNSMIHIQINMLETLRKKLCSKMLKQKVGVAPSKISTLLFSPQVCPVPKDIFKSHSILTGKVARTETFETHLAYAWHRIERHLSTLCFHLWIKIQRSISCCLPVDIGEGTWSKMNQWFKGGFSGEVGLGVLES